MKAYSPDLREKIVRALELQEETQNEIADRFQVSLSFVEKLWHRWRNTGSFAANPHAGGQKRSLRDHSETLRQAVASQPDATLRELADCLLKAQAPQVSQATVCRELKRLNLPLKKSLSTPQSETAKGSKPYEPNIWSKSARVRSRS
jgi:transposase